MKISIRRGVFETNSSSVHSITMCTADEFNKWKTGEILFDKEYEKLVTLEDAKKSDEYEDEDYKRFLTYEEFNSYEYMEYETYSSHFTTPGGETVYAFGYFGHD